MNYNYLGISLTNVLSFWTNYKKCIEDYERLQKNGVKSMFIEKNI
jgi:hypothetical protein